MIVTAAIRAGATAVVLTLGAATAVAAQQNVVQHDVTQHDTATLGTVGPDIGDSIAVPFGAGEALEYAVSFGRLRVGSGRLAVDGVDTVRGVPAYRAVLTVDGGIPFFRVHDVFESWMDVRTLHSLRFVQDQREGRRHRERRYEIFPERATYREEIHGDGTEQPSVANPLDDVAFLYFVRTVPLEVGETYTFDRYFRPDRNPVTVRVLRRETVTVPAGTFSALVIQPTVKTRSGIFGEDGHAQVWLSDDEHRVVLQLKSKLRIGSLNLYLRSMRLAEDAP